MRCTPSSVPRQAIRSPAFCSHSHLGEPHASSASRWTLSCTWLVCPSGQGSVVHGNNETRLSCCSVLEGAWQGAEGRDTTSTNICQNVDNYAENRQFYQPTHMGHWVPPETHHCNDGHMHTSSSIHKCLHNTATKFLPSICWSLPMHYIVSLIETNGQRLRV